MSSPRKRQHPDKGCEDPRKRNTLYRPVASSLFFDFQAEAAADKNALTRVEKFILGELHKLKDCGSEHIALNRIAAMPALLNEGTAEIAFGLDGVTILLDFLEKWSKKSEFICLHVIFSLMIMSLHHPKTFDSIAKKEDGLSSIFRVAKYYKDSANLEGEVLRLLSHCKDVFEVSEQVDISNCTKSALSSREYIEFVLDVMKRHPTDDCRIQRLGFDFICVVASTYDGFEILTEHNIEETIQDVLDTRDKEEDVWEAAHDAMTSYCKCRDIVDDFHSYWQ